MRTVNCVKWFRDHAAHDRAQEEKEILECESERVQCSFLKMVKAWTALAKKAVPGSYCSYTYRQASMYDTFNSHCWDAYSKACALYIFLTASVTDRCGQQTSRYCHFNLHALSMEFMLHFKRPSQCSLQGLPTLLR